MSGSPPNGPATQPVVTGLDRDGYREILRATIARIKRDDVPSLAAGVAFKIFLSLFPAAIATVAVFSIVTSPEDLAAVTEAASDLLPRRAAEVVPVGELVEAGGAGAGGLAIGGVLAGLWAATSAAVTLAKALSRAYEVEETRKFVRQRTVALAITLALFVALVALVLLLVAGGPLQEALVPPQLGAAAGALLTAARLAGALVVLVLLFAFVYWVGPDRPLRGWTWMSPGAVVGVVGWLAVSGGFTLYVRLAGNYEATYGALAGVIVLLLWLQMSMLFLLAGATLNAVIERAADRRAALQAGAGFALARPHAVATSAAPDSGDGLVLAGVPMSPGDPLPGLEARGEAHPDGSRPAARAGFAAIAAGALIAFLGLRRRRRSTALGPR